MKTASIKLHAGLEANHWATRLLDAYTYVYDWKSWPTTWVLNWPSPTAGTVTNPPAYGSFGGYGIWVHGIWGI